MPNKYMDSEDEDNFYDGLSRLANVARDSANRSVWGSALAWLALLINVLFSYLMNG